MGKPYLLPDVLNVDQHAEINIYEVLKGDPGMTTLTVTDLVGLVNLPGDRNAISLEGIVGLLEPQEKVLLFLAKSEEGDYIPLAGTRSKFVIDEKRDSATREGGFIMSLKELKRQIKEVVKLPVKEYKTIPLEEMY